MADYGGGGFIGSHLTRHLYRQGRFVRVADIKFDVYVEEEYCRRARVIQKRVDRMKTRHFFARGIHRHPYRFALQIDTDFLRRCLT